MSVTRLVVELGTPPEAEAVEGLAGVEGLALGPQALEGPLPPLPEGAPLALCGVDPEVAPAWHGRPDTVWVCDGGLEETARLRDAWPDLVWVPRTTVYQPTVRYEFSPHLGTESFKFYVPDMGAMLARRVGDGDQDVRRWVVRAAELGFGTVWLHGSQAEERGRGLDLEALVRARSRYDGAIWISGGVTELRHLENLRREGGAAAVVLPPDRIAALGVAPALAALRPQAGEALAVEVARGGCPGAAGEGLPA
ncbi:hypothetical protein [Inmirania thermothiophila]|uniref:Uncharacterized protein n=1 Tax=Inmirania thermothiophila TaxID=1750597 RepID=A0A3N1Y0C7_9GAMM|nr:hypothetical protein [Inmirania thermothiophila]ROR31971.1 hypothetical protein EDC57_1153 [Inmirania thermothiophila]